MVERSSIPHDIEDNWSDFVSVWCAGDELGYGPHAVQRAFGALRRLYPEHIATLEQNFGKGSLTTAPAIALGLDLAECEELEGLQKIADRLRKGEAASLAEIEVAAALTRCGYVPRLEPPLAGKQLDSLIRVAGTSVFIEVISPVHSEPMRSACAELHGIANAIVKLRVGVHVDILLDADPTTVRSQVIQHVANAPCDGWVHRVDELALLLSVTPLKNETTLQLRGPAIERSLRAPMLWQSAGHLYNGKLVASAAVGHVMDDERVHRLLSAELHHFAKDGCNVIVVSVTNVPGGITWWGDLVERWFQPTRNTRIGAVVLYDAVLTTKPTRVRQRWRAYRNPYALVAVPAELLDRLKSLDDPMAWL